VCAERTRGAERADDPRALAVQQEEPMTSVALPSQTLALAVTACAVALGVSWLAGSTVGLLVPIAALSLYAKGRAAVMLGGVLLVAAIGSALAAWRIAGVADQLALYEGAVSSAAVFVAALCTQVAVAAGAFAPSRRSDEMTPPGLSRITSAATTAKVEPASRDDLHPDDRPAADHAATRAFWTGVPQMMRYRWRQPDGSYRWTATRTSPGYGAVIEVDDLETQVERPTTAASSRPDGGDADAIRAAHVVENLFGNGWAFDAEGRWIYLPLFAQTTLGLTPEELNASLSEGGISWKRILHPDEYETVATNWRHCLDTGAPFHAEFRIRRATGVYAWARSAARPTRDGEGRITGWYGTSLDIDVHKKTEAALRERQRELQQLIDAVPALIWCMTPDGVPSYVNKRFTDEVGVTLADLSPTKGSRILAGIHPDDRHAVDEALSRAIASGSVFFMRYRQRRMNGCHRWTEGRAEPLRDETGAIVQWYGVCVDVHDLVTTQETVREREFELAQLVNMVPSFLWRLTASGEPDFFNTRLIEFFGPDAVTADSAHPGGLTAIIDAAVHPEDKERLRRSLAHSFATGERFALRYRLLRADGVYRWVDGSAEALRDEGGRIVWWYGLTNDIDDQMKAEEALRERERFLWQLVETLPAMIDCAAPDGEPVYRSRQLREFLGYNLEDLADGTRLDRTLAEGVHPDDLADVKAAYARALASGEPYLRKHRLRRFDGEYRWVETRAAAMRDADGAIVQWNVICLDIESEVRAQESLRLAQDSLARASQAASLAELSASIAHEVNQPLAAVVANSHACHRWLAAAPPNLDRARITVERIIRDANSAADVVSRIRALFRQSAETRTRTTLPSLVAEARRLMAEEASRRGVRIDVAIAEDLPPVALDRVQIQQVLVNLMRNGMDAMAGDGAETLLSIDVRRMGDAVRIGVTDRGPPADLPETIFEPFYSTKAQGMGMGLAICRSIVEAHGGRLWVEKNAPQGATFVFTLPAELEEVS
jgi:PAS domain S-box-containing protein